MFNLQENTWNHIVTVVDVKSNSTDYSIYTNNTEIGQGTFTNFVPVLEWSSLTRLVMNIGKKNTDNTDLSPAFLQDFRLYDKLSNVKNISQLFDMETALYDTSTTTNTTSYQI